MYIIPAILQRISNTFLQYSMLRAIQTHTVRAQNTAIIISTVCNICSKYDDIKSNYHLLNMNVMRGENTTKSRSVSEGLGWKPIFISFQYFTSVIVLHAGMICRNIFHGVQSVYKIALFTCFNSYRFLISELYLGFYEVYFCSISLVFL